MDQLDTLGLYLAWGCDLGICVVVYGQRSNIQDHGLSQDRTIWWGGVGRLDGWTIFELRSPIFDRVRKALPRSRKREERQDDTDIFHRTSAS